jgi:chromosomal replication initiation ATPase DnaA
MTSKDISLHAALSQYEWEQKQGIKKKKATNIERLFRAINTVTKVSKAALTSPDKHRIYIESRQIFCYIAHTYFDLTLKAIGRALNRDHTTVLHSIRQFKICMELNENGIRGKVKEVKGILNIIQSYEYYED